MKYRNANDVLPPELLARIQEYVQGEYIYVPVKEKRLAKPPTDYRTELEKRDVHIFHKYLEGMDRQQLSQKYNLSESSIRRILAKQRKGAMKMKEHIIQVIQNWELENKDVKQISPTTWQVGEGYVLKGYQDFSMLERNLKILQILDHMGIPVGKIVPARNHKPYVSSGSMGYFLSRKLPGNHLMHIENDTGIASVMGGIIADLHIAFKRCETENTFWNNSLLDEMNGWVKNALEAGGWKYIEKEKYEGIVARLAALYEDLPVQLIHRDVHFGNFLFSEGKFSGYIDFDLSQRNIRVFDLCYFLLGLLSEEKLGITGDAWFEFEKNLFAGYGRKQKLTEAEKQAVPYVMECIELLFVSYFERINDLKCAENAYQLFEFVERQENRVRRNVR